MRSVTTLQETLAQQVPSKQADMARLKKEHGSHVYVCLYFCIVVFYSFVRSFVHLYSGFIDIAVVLLDCLLVVWCAVVVGEAIAATGIQTTCLTTSMSYPHVTQLPYYFTCTI